MACTVLALVPPDDPNRPITRDELVGLFHRAETPRDAWRIGGEAEKFGVDVETGAPLQYEGDRGVVRVFTALEAHGWRPISETDGGPVIALSREDASITLEPAAQLELSGAPVDSVHEICSEMRGHLRELEAISEEMNVAWLGIGFHPLARHDDLPWVPKARYPVMRDYLPTRGSRALDMMKRTATVQANYDFEDERDAMRKLVVSLRLAPIANAMLANSPFVEGRVSGRKSERGHVWLHMDPTRSGLIPTLWDREELGYDDYVEWALDAGMFLFRRGDEFVHNTGQTFRRFLEDGYEGHRPTHADWTSHVNSLFPEARLKTTIEVRCVDSLPRDLACAMPALFTGILYDRAALQAASELSHRYDYEAMRASREALVERGLGAKIGRWAVMDLALELLDIAEGGLERRGKLSPGGKDERIHLARLRSLIETGESPADRLIRSAPAAPSPVDLVRAARV